MIPASHRKWALAFFNRYLDRLIKKNFSHYYLVNDFPVIENDMSILITPNHISWWDGFFCQVFLRRYDHRKIHLMMLEEQLAKHWYFSRIGAYSIEPSKPASVLETFRYTRSILGNPANLVIMYPQGEIEPFFKRPLSLKQGVRSVLNERLPTRVLPVAFSINHYNEKYPEIALRFGGVIKPSVILEDFNFYVDAFHQNVSLLHTAVENREFKKDFMKEL